MDAEKNKKLQQYAITLNEQATGEEKSGKVQEAAKHYLKLVDVFLVLAAEAPDHNTWQQYIHQAETYQNRARSILPRDQQATPAPAQRKELPPSPQRNDIVQNRPNPLKKIIRPFQKTEALLPDPPADEPSNPVPVEIKTPNVPMDSIPAEVYQRMVTENKLLRERVSSVTKETEERILSLQKENVELQNRMTEMVPRSDYEILQAEFTNMVPRNEYDRVRAQFLNMVPKEHYDELLNRISQMVPKQDYLEAERRILQLEDEARNSVPKKVIDDLANEISMLAMLSEVPIETKEHKESSSELVI